jgi:DNA ligase-1
MNKREFLQLAEDYVPDKHRMAGMYYSEKLDGYRCFWDGGISRGRMVHEIPWANKDALGRTFPATGLWSRYGHPVHAPDLFVERLPYGIPLDGELYMGRGGFQKVGFVKGHDKNHVSWHFIKYLAFNMPTYEQVFAPGRINNPNFVEKIIGPECMNFVPSELRGKQVKTFDEVVKRLESYGRMGLGIVEHKRLPSDESSACEIVNNLAKELATSTPKGEGVMLADPYYIWTPKRNTNLLKVKPLYDAEGIVLGYVSGNRTTKGSKLLGKLGALIVSWEGKTFKVNAGNDMERTLSDPSYASEHPGEEMPSHVDAPFFPRGSTITFQYRELSDDGVPKEARYFRKPL